MKQQVSPAVAGILILVVIAVVLFFGYKAFRGPAGSREGEQPPGMPPDVAAEFQRRGAAANGPGNTSRPNTSAPTIPGTSTPMPMAPH